MKPIGLMTAGLLILGTFSCGPKLDKDGRPITLGRFRLRTFPKGAKVWVDGKLEVVSTPATLVKEEGQYHLRIQKPGAEALETTIFIEAGASRDLNLRIPKPRPATISILSDEADAEVRINGYRRGTTPLWNINTRPGPVDITVSTFDGRAKSLRTQLAVSEQKRIELFFRDVFSQPPPPETTPEPQCQPKLQGELTLGLKPHGIVETRAGQRLGQTPIQRKKMTPGSHALVLRSKDGRYEKRVTIDIKEGQHAIYRFMLTSEDEVPGWSAKTSP